MKTVYILSQFLPQSPLVLELSWLEHLTVNQRVVGSSPTGGAIKEKSVIVPTFLFATKKIDNHNHHIAIITMTKNPKP